MESIWHMLSTAHEMALAQPSSELGRFIGAMRWWRYSLGQVEKEAIDLMMAVEPTMPGEIDRFKALGIERQWKVKGFIPVALFALMNRFYPGFIRNEDFLDEFFTKHPLGIELANPLWRPKPASERKSRGLPSQAKNVMRQLADGTYEPYTRTLARPLLAGGERTCGA